MSYRGKIVLLGNAGVGKSSLLSRYVFNQFNEEYTATLGANYLIKEIDLNKIIDKIHSVSENWKKEIKQKGFKLYYWDIGGQQDKLFVNEYYFEYALGAMVVFNLSDLESFNNLDFWISKLKELNGEIPFIIVGNKSDLIKKSPIQKGDIEKKTNRYKVSYFETSAKLNVNVTDAFEALTVQVINNFKP